MECSYSPFSDVSAQCRTGPAYRGRKSRESEGVRVREERRDRCDGDGEGDGETGGLAYAGGRCFWPNMM